MSEKITPWYSFSNLRRKIFGAPIATAHAHHERLSSLLALPVFASDALSSVAYATEAILSVLILSSHMALSYQLGLTAAICVLIIIISLSYQQTIREYPKGGGSYIVASENLGPKFGVLAGSALLFDYVLTVAVSISAGVAAIVSAYPVLHSMLVPISVGMIVIVAWANLRGIRESGAVFAIPTYAFIVGMMAMIVLGIVKTVGTPVPPPHAVADPGMIGSEAKFLFVFILLRAFAAGCTALTGVEAVADGVPAFKPPESKNAIKTLRWMTVILTAMFLGIGFLSQYLPTVALYTAKMEEHRTLVSQLSAFVFGQNSIPFYALQFATALILVLAANTAFADFPRLGSFMARDGFLPRALSRQGDRLVFHNGIILLAVTAAILVWHFHGELDQLLPLYAVGVFTAFTLSQLGMVYHWKKQTERNRAWGRNIGINIVGATLCFIVLLIILITKFTEGAWIVAILLPVLYITLYSIKKRYAYVAEKLSLAGNIPEKPIENISLLLVPRVHRGIVAAKQYAALTAPNVQAVHINLNEKALPEVQRLWDQYGNGVPLVVLSSPYRSLIDPLLDYVDRLLEENPNHMVTVIVPEAVSNKLMHKILTENVASQLKSALGQRKNVVITNVRYFLDA